MTAPDTPQPAPQPDLIGGITQRGVQLGVSLLVTAALLFAGAGRLDWQRGWLCLGLSAALLVANLAVLLATQPQVIAERARPRFTERFDRVFTGLYVPLSLVVPLVAGLDAGHRGAVPLGAPVAWLGAALMVAGDAWVVWALAVNPFLETTVRIQSERGQRPITHGPYRWVRHPMYLGMIVIELGTPLLLGSRWALLPVAAIAAALVYRTVEEDRLLCRALPGYADYARRTRSRLLPGIW